MHYGTGRYRFEAELNLSNNGLKTEQAVLRASGLAKARFSPDSCLELHLILSNFDDSKSAAFAVIARLVGRFTFGDNETGRSCPYFRLQDRFPIFSGTFSIPCDNNILRSVMALRDDSLEWFDTKVPPSKTDIEMMTSDWFQTRATVADVQSGKYRVAF